MPGNGDNMKVLLWLDADQAALAGAFVRTLGLDVVAVGSPAGSRLRESALGEGLGDEAETFDDLRQMLQRTEARLALLLTSLQGRQATSRDNQLAQKSADLLRLARSREIRVGVLEPSYMRAVAQIEEEAPAVRDLIRYIPLLTECRAAIEAGERLSVIAPVRLVSVASRSSAHQSTLGGHLFGAAQFIHSIIQTPDLIDATVVTQTSASGLHLAPGGTLDMLRGHLTANMRSGAGKSGSLSLSDRAGRWFRGVTIIGDHGTIRIGEHGFECVNSEGEPIDSWKDDLPGDPEDAFVPVVCRELDRWLHGRLSQRAPFDLHAVLSICGAAMLSARTAQGESPATVQRMTGLHGA